MTGKRKNKTFSFGLVKEGIDLSLNYQGTEQDRTEKKGSVFYHPEGKKSPNQRLRSCFHRAIEITTNIITFKDLDDFMPLPLISTAPL